MGSFDPSQHYSSGHPGSPPSLKHEPSFGQMPPNTLQPTWQGYVADTADALALFQGAIDGVLRKVVRRPHDRERSEVIRSGAVFIYEESASGIKRWTDGVPWSPSRILGNFLIYRELDKPFPPGEKKRAAKKFKATRPGAPYPSRGRAMDEMGGMGGDGDNGNGSTAMMAATSPTGPHSGMPSAMPAGMSSPILNVKQESSGTPDRDLERSLVGSLTDSYTFKEGGLVKKTLSINHNGGHLHLVSYYTPDDVMNDRLLKREHDARLAHIQVAPELVRAQSFRSPVEGSEESVSPISATPTHRSSMPNSFMNNTTSPGYGYPMVPQQNLPPQQQQQPNAYFPVSNHSSAYQYSQQYGQATNYDYARSMPPAGSGSVAGVAQQYQALPQNTQMAMHQEQGNYMPQSSYQIQDPRAAQNLDQQYSTWPGGQQHR